MADYKIEIKKSAVKELKALPNTTLKRMIDKINSLAINPRPSGCKKLSGDEKYRIGVGDYRILYAINDDILLIYIVKVAHGREVYK
jgi:mRNA interferase RelE/StbE